MKKFTTEEVVSKSKEVHGDRYDYSEVNYKNAKTPINVICKEHGLFPIRLDVHLKGRGCSKCKGYNLEEGDLKKLVQSVYNGNYSYVSFNKDSNKIQVKMFCEKHGEFVKRIDHVRNHSICNNCFNEKQLDKYKSDFINESKKVHKNKYDYSLVDYKDALNKVCIICPIHGKFYQIPASHKSGKGCHRCGGSFELSFEDFVERANTKHNNFYNYTGSISKNTKKVTIECPIHGEFTQRIHEHLNGQGCIKCWRDNFTEKQKNFPNGWTTKRWEEASKKSKKFDSFKVYIIRCWNENEEFFKIGRTFQRLKYRLSSFPYSYEVVQELNLADATSCIKEEELLKEKHIFYKYVPQLKFQGMYECFSHILDEYKK